MLRSVCRTPPSQLRRSLSAFLRRLSQRDRPHGSMQQLTHPVLMRLDWMRMGHIRSTKQPLLRVRKCQPEGSTRTAANCNATKLGRHGRQTGRGAECSPRDMCRQRRQQLWSARKPLVSKRRPRHGFRYDRQVAGLRRAAFGWACGKPL